MKPFNLEEFKAGKPALARAGAVATFVEYREGDDYPLIAKIRATHYSYTPDGRYSTGNDLIGMVSDVSCSDTDNERMAEKLRMAGYTVTDPPRTITINGIKVPEPLRDAQDGESIWVVSTSAALEGGAFVVSAWHDGIASFSLWLKNGLCHSSKENAEKHFQAIISASRC